jgi:parvulin-like peptidyl-prolyl isomerase
MNPNVSRRLLAVVALLTALGCSKPEETVPSASATPAATPAAAGTPGTGTPESTPAPIVSVESLPAVVARVNGYEVPKNDFVQAVTEAQVQLAQVGRSQQTTLAFLRRVLDHVVDQILLEQEGRKAGIVPTEAEVAQQLNALKSRAPSPEQFAQALSQRGLTEENLTEQIRRTIAVERYLLTKVMVNKPPEEVDIRAYYDQNPDKMQKPERRHLRHILLRAENNAPQPVRVEAQKKAEAILGRLQKGEDFAKLAQEFSDDSGSKGLGGDLSWVARGQTVPSFEAAAFALQKPNDLSAVVESPVGYHVIQLLEIEAASLRPYAEVRDRIAAFLKQRRAREQAEAKVRELREQAEVKVFL